MSEPRIILGAERAPLDYVPIESGAGWNALLVMAVALLLVAATDIGLALYPRQFGDAVWRFQVLASVANGLPMVTMGALVLLGASARNPGSALMRAAVVLNWLVVGGILAATGVFLASVGPAFAAVPTEAAVGLRRAVFKTVVIFVAFGAAHCIAALAGVRSLRSARDDMRLTEVPETP